VKYSPDYFCREEYSAYIVYSALARNPLLPRRYREIFEKSASEEYKHYLFWKKYSEKCTTRLVLFKSALYTALVLLFGVTFTLKLLERREKRAVLEYSAVAERRRELSGDLEALIREELEHEDRFVSSIHESRVKYLGSIALGISDALVELTGIYAGSLGAFASTLIAGLTGLLAGISASLSMTAASYIQAKSSHVEKPLTAALFTGLAYVTVTVLLSLPYFLLTSLLHAFTAMIVTAVAISLYMALYTAILGEKSFKREILETTGLLLGVSLLLYLLGRVLGTYVTTQ
jgi:VIT1/CCC1 family predicted Fe2+/Mn2+ transporter